MPLPDYLSKLSTDIPNFLTNDTLLYITDDKIMLGYNFLANTKNR